MNPRELKFLTVAAIMAAGLGLAGCGGGGSSSPPALSMLDVTAPVMPGTYSTSAAPAALVAAFDDYEGPTSADEGESLTVGGYTLTCTAGPCSVSVSADGGTFTVSGTISVFGAMAMMPPGPTPAEMAAQERMAILTAITAASTAVGMVDDDADEATVAAANTAIQTARTAIMDAENVPAEELAGNMREVNQIQATLTAAETSRTAAIKAKDDADRKAAAAVVTKAAGTKLKAMNAEAGQATDAGLGGDEPGDRAYELEIKRDRTGTTITVKDPDRPATTQPKFTLTQDLGDGRQMFTLTNPADADGDVVEEVVIVGTDIKAPRAVAFARVAGQALNARDLNPAVDADKDGTANNDFTALFVGADGATAPDADTLKLVKSAAFPLTGNARLDFDSDDATTDRDDEADEVRGTYNGAMGTYRCDAATDCTVTVSVPAGKTERAITAMSAGWVFTPDAGVTSDVRDASYLHYGFWLKKTTDEDGVLTYNEVETFAGASIAASGTVAAVTGTASYDGEAVGVYVHHVLSEGGGQIESSTSGHFKADASLMATFGQVPVSATDTTGTIAPNLLDSVTGTIDNFTLSGGEGKHPPRIAGYFRLILAAG